MKTGQIIILIVSFFLGMLLLNMVKNTCGCELKEGFTWSGDAKAAEVLATISGQCDGTASQPLANSVNNCAMVPGLMPGMLENAPYNYEQVSAVLDSDSECGTFVGYLDECNTHFGGKCGGTPSERLKSLESGSCDVVDLSTQICVPGCQHDGSCASDGKCVCVGGWAGEACQTEETCGEAFLRHPNGSACGGAHGRDSTNVDITKSCVDLGGCGALSFEGGKCCKGESQGAHETEPTAGKDTRALEALITGLKTYRSGSVNQEFAVGESWGEGEGYSCDDVVAPEFLITIPSDTSLVGLSEFIGGCANRIGADASSWAGGGVGWTYNPDVGCGWSGTSDHVMTPHVEVGWNSRMTGNPATGPIDHVIPFIEKCSELVSGQVTYRLYIKSNSDNLTNVYAVSGTADHPLTLPPRAVQGGRGVEFGSWLTVEGQGGRGSQSPSSIGVETEISKWSNIKGLTVDDGSVFLLAPDNGPLLTNASPVLLAQITISNDTPLVASMSVQGRSAVRGLEWQAHLNFSLPAAGESVGKTVTLDPESGACSELQVADVTTGACLNTYCDGDQSCGLYGSCQSGVEVFGEQLAMSCICDPGWHGALCQNQHDANTCAPGCGTGGYGTCKNDGTCECTSGRYGDICQQTVPPQTGFEKHFSCAPDGTDQGCLNGGLCVGPGPFGSADNHCACIDGYTGEFCAESPSRGSHLDTHLSAQGWTLSTTDTCTDGAQMITGAGVGGYDVSGDDTSEICSGFNPAAGMGLTAESGGEDVYTALEEGGICCGHQEFTLDGQRDQYWTANDSVLKGDMTCEEAVQLLTADPGGNELDLTNKCAGYNVAVARSYRLGVNAARTKDDLLSAVSEPGRCCPKECLAVQEMWFDHYCKGPRGGEQVSDIEAVTLGCWVNSSGRRRFGPWLDADHGVESCSVSNPDDHADASAFTPSPLVAGPPTQCDAAEYGTLFSTMQEECCGEVTDGGGPTCGESNLPLAPACAAGTPCYGRGVEPLLQICGESRYMQGWMTNELNSRCGLSVSDQSSDVTGGGDGDKPGSSDLPVCGPGAPITKDIMGSFLYEGQVMTAEDNAALAEYWGQLLSGGTGCINPYPGTNWDMSCGTGRYYKDDESNDNNWCCNADDSEMTACTGGGSSTGSTSTCESFDEWDTTYEPALLKECSGVAMESPWIPDVSVCPPACAQAARSAQGSGCMDRLSTAMTKADIYGALNLVLQRCDINKIGGGH